MKPSTLPPRRVVTIPEAAQLLSVSRSTLDRMPRRGDLRATTVAGMRRVEVAEIDAYLTRQRQADLAAEHEAGDVDRPAWLGKYFTGARGSASNKGVRL